MDRGSSNAALRLTIVVWGFGYLLVAIFMTLQSRASFPVSLLAQTPLFLFAVAMMTAGRRVLVGVIRRPPIVRWLLTGVAAALGTIAISLADTVWLYLLARTLAPEWASWATEISVNRAASIALLYSWTVCLNITLLWAVDVNERARTHLARAAEAEAAAHRAEATVLRLQLNPHFLFNALNAIMSLVVTRRHAEAEAMIGQLAVFLRASLASDPNSVIPLSEEIASAKAYLEIEKARFGGRMTVRMDVGPDTPEACVPNFILQPLVENAVKHGVATTQGPVELRLSASRRQNELVVAVVNQRSDEDPPPLSTAIGANSGVGLSNVRQRLNILYGEKAGLRTSSSPRGYKAVVNLPYSRC